MKPTIFGYFFLAFIVIAFVGLLIKGFMATTGLDDLWYDYKYKKKLEKGKDKEQSVNSDYRFHDSDIA